MKKDFWEWHILKVKLNDQEYQKFFHEREIWFCSIGLNIGREQDGKHEWFERPVIIVKKFNQETFWAIPLTTKYHANARYYFGFRLDGKLVFANLSQLRLMDVRRVLRKAGMMHQKDFESLKQRIRSFLS